MNLVCSTCRMNFIGATPKQILLHVYEFHNSDFYRAAERAGHDKDDVKDLAREFEEIVRKKLPQ